MPIRKKKTKIPRKVLIAERKVLIAEIKRLDEENKNLKDEVRRQDAIRNEPQTSESDDSDSEFSKRDRNGKRHKLLHWKEDLGFSFFKDYKVACMCCSMKCQSVCETCTDIYGYVRPIIICRVTNRKDDETKETCFEKHVRIAGEFNERFNQSPRRVPI